MSVGGYGNVGDITCLGADMELLGTSHATGLNIDSPYAPQMVEHEEGDGGDVVGRGVGDEGLLPDVLQALSGHLPLGWGRGGVRYTSGIYLLK